MPAITITEALAEFKTVEKCIEKKREFVLTYLLRQEMFRDPLEKDGGSASALARELQAVRDLDERKVAVRRAIAQANEANRITVGRQTRTIADWLVWRREVAPRLTQFYATVRAKIEQARQEAARKGTGVGGPGEAGKPSDIVVNVNEQELAREIESLEETLGQLDGQLSLKNATITVEL